MLCKSLSARAATAGAHQHKLVFSLDSLGDRIDVKVTPQTGNRRDNRYTIGIGQKVHYERSINFDAIEWEHPQIVERKYLVPKSSRTKENPKPRNWCSIFKFWVFLCIKIDSVISNSRRSGAKLDALKPPPPWNYAGDRLTAIPMRGGQFMASVYALRRPILRVVYQIGYFGQWNETIGGIKPRCGWCQRARHSTPTASKPEVSEWSLKRAQHETNSVPHFHSILNELHRDLI